MNYNKYYLYKKEYRKGDVGLWHDYIPLEYSIDGDGTEPLALAETDVVDCGYSPQPPSTIYKTIQSSEIDCDLGVYICKLYTSSNNGESWNYVGDVSYSVLTADTSTCTGESIMYTVTYLDGSIEKFDCSGDTYPTPSQNRDNIRKLHLGRCATVIPSSLDGENLAEISMDDNGVMTSFTASHVDALSSVTLGNSVLSLSISFCPNLTDINIPTSVKEIGKIRVCSSLVRINLPNSIITIGEYAFDSCTSLSSVTIPNSVTSIGKWAFQYCISLKSATIGSGVTSIGNGVFYNCSGLTSVTVLATTPPTIGSDVFTSDCPIFVPCESVDVYKSSWSSYASRIKGIPPCIPPTPTGATKIYCTYDNGSIYYKYCSDLTELTSGDTNPSWYEASSMTSIVIGDCVTSISNGVFSNCTSLTSITVNATTPPALGTNVFDNTNDCPIFVPCEKILVYKYATNWSSYASRIRGIPPCNEPTGTTKFSATYLDGRIYSPTCNSSRDLTSGETHPSGYDASAMTSVEISDCVTSIGVEAFGTSYLPNVCRNLSSVTIANSVTSIGQRAFYNCSGLTSIDIPNSVASIGDFTFAYCSSLTSIDIPDSVITIGNQAFVSCENLISVTIPNSVTYIDGGAFYYSESLTSITCLATTPPQIVNHTFNVIGTFDKTNNCPIYVPAASVDAYKSSWSSYASRIQPIT